jgi:hypothetical protein
MTSASRRVTSERAPAKRGVVLACELDGVVQSERARLLRPGRASREAGQGGQ